MEHDRNAWLLDIRNAIGELEECKRRCPDFPAFKNDRIVQRAVERCIGIIGEAVIRLTKSAPDLAISDARKIISTRHKIVHDYEKVSIDVLWLILDRHIPVLRLEVDALLDRLG